MTTASSRPTSPTTSAAPASPTCSPCPGQNVAFALALAGPLLRRLRLWPRLVATLAVIGLFGVMTRFEPSVLRASAMAALAATLACRAPRSRGCASSRWPSPALLLVDPLLVRSVGFQLSVCAAVAIVVLAPRLASVLPGPRGRFGRPLAVTLAAQLGVAPVLLATFGPCPSPRCRPTCSRPGRRPGDDVGSHRRAGRRRGRRTLAAGSSTCRPALALGWLELVAERTAARAARRAAPARRSLALAVGLAVVGRWPASRRGVRRSGGASRSARCSSAVVAAHAPRRCATPLAPGVVRWHAGGADVVVLGGRVAGRASAAPTVLEALRRAGVGTIDLLVVADAVRPGVGRRARARRPPASACDPRRSPDGAADDRARRRCRCAIVVGARPARRRRRARGPLTAVAERRGRFGPRGLAPWSVVWEVPCPTVALGPHRFDVRHRALVMGILNRTPDSFFDQGAYFDFDGFLAKAEQLVAEGADFLDVGGVKAGPGPEVTRRRSSSG